MTASRRALVLDLALAATGLTVSLARSWHPETGWLHADLWPLAVVMLAPALIPARRAAPIPVAAGLMTAALLGLMLGRVEWFLVLGCALALWSVAAMRIRFAAAGVVLVTVALPVLASARWKGTIWSFFDNIHHDPALVEYRGQLVEGASYGILEADLVRFQSTYWPWWLSALLAAVWLTGFAVRRYRGLPPVVSTQGTPGDWLEALRGFAASPENRLWLDAMLAISLTALQLVDIRRGQAYGLWWVAPDWLIYTIVAMPLTLVLRRILPVVPCVLLAAVCIPAFWAADDIPFLLAALAIALYSLGAHRKLLLVLPVATVVIAAVPVLSRLAIEHYQVQLWFFPVIGQTIDPEIPYGPPLQYGYEYFRVSERIWPISLSLALALTPLLGVLARLYRRNRAVSLREAELERRTAEQDAAQVVLTERSHIARDLHDVVAHAVNLMVIQAETGPDLLERGDKDVLAGFQRIGDAGRRALGELDRMLSALRDADGMPDPALAPQPGLADLPRLVSDVAHDGLAIELDLQGDPDRPPAGHQLAAYRLVQEALTNVVRHSGATKVTARVDVRDDDVLVRVADDGRGFEPEVAHSGGRQGLAGMGERVRIHNGELAIDSAPGRGTTITARLPLVTAQEAAR
ncbi:MAG TPA: ATP-binding protein [Kribbella sp.]|uniref:ATP-binding protein n=1 Tax=Kribbella sp. TaxID=1871183 RepID=UPI002D76E680|nr:ATP-binding protein [Kribbella sp.]HET6292426.1 ATP-binding protein [Kribbella sp.]